MRHDSRRTTDQDEVRLGLIRSLESPVWAIELLPTEAHYTSGVPVVVTVSGGTTDTSEIVYRIAKRWKESDPDEWYEEQSKTQSVYDELSQTQSADDERSEKLLHNLERLNSFRFLRPGWNGYDADPLDDAVISRARDVLLKTWFLKHNPEIFPTARDSIQFEYRREDGGYLEVEIYGDSFGVYLSAGGKETEKDGLSRDEITAMIRDFYAE